MTLDNKGSLGGAMTLNGSVKFANSGFESWSGSDYITRDLGEPFLPTNSFTVATAFDFQNTSTQGSNRGWWSSLFASSSNRVEHLRLGTPMYNQSISSGVSSINTRNYVLGLGVLVSSYNFVTKELILLNFDGNNTNYTSISYNNINDVILRLLSSSVTTNTYSGADNPLHEFRLYDRAMSLTEMQTLQTELNNKYTT